MNLFYLEIGIIPIGSSKIKLWPQYENWSKLGKQNRVYWYTLNVYRYTLASGGVYRYTPVHVPVHLPKFAQILLFFPTFDANSLHTTSTIHKHFKTTSKSSYDLFSTQFIIQSISFIKTFHDFLSKPLYYG